MNGTMQWLGRLILQVLSVAFLSATAAQGVDCRTDCRKDCGGNLGIIIVPPLAGNCITACEVAKAASCAVHWRIPSVGEAISSVFNGACSAPFEAITAAVVAQCSNWSGRGDDLSLIAEAKNRLIQSGFFSAGDFAGVDIRWCPIPNGSGGSNTAGIVPRPNTVYLHVNGKNRSLDERAELLAHEMIHVQQFRKYGDDSFRCEYGKSYLDCRNCQDERHPLEREAYWFQAGVRSSLRNIPVLAPGKDCADPSTSGQMGEDRGYFGGQQLVDADGNGCLDYCRVVGDWPNNARVRCTLSPRGKGGSYRDVLSEPLAQWGYNEWRWWVDFDRNGLIDFCRIAGNVGDLYMFCTPFEGDRFGNTRTVKHPIDRGYEWSGYWLDVDSNGFPDYCRRVEGGDKTDCQLNIGGSRLEGTKRISYP